MVVNLRARIRTQDAQIRKFPKPPSDDDTKSGEEVEPSLIAEYPDDMEIPAALVGARCKEAIEHFAPILGTTPVTLLRAAVAEGLTGGRPVAKELLKLLDDLVEAGVIRPPSKPPPVN